MRIILLLSVFPKKNLGIGFKGFTSLRFMSKVLATGQIKSTITLSLLCGMAQLRYNITIIRSKIILSHALSCTERKNCMSYRLIAIDLDDTLLREDLTVSEGTRQAMTEAIARGVHITIATGRMFDSAQKIARQVGLNVPIITYQGSLIKNLLDEEVLYERSVPVEIAEKLYAYCQEHGLHLQSYIGDKLHVAEDNDKIRAYAKQSNIPYTIEPDFGKVIAHERQTKLLIITSLRRSMP